MSITIISCGVLTTDLRHLLKKSKIKAELIPLPGGLHKNPSELRKRLQMEIDNAENNSATERIVIGYGICGHGTTGISARTKPLVIPRVHDCIALFLGSDKAYNDQFAKAPGTYYVSAGWVNENTEPLQQSHSEAPGFSGGINTPDDNLKEHYGAENADAIHHFMNSWQRNYQRAAFIDTGVTRKNNRFKNIAKKMASDFGWKYETLPGSHTLLEQMLTVSETTPQILIVRPNERTYYDAIRRHLSSALPGSNTFSTAQSDPPQPASTGRHLANCLTLGIDAGGTYTDAALFTPSTHTVEFTAKAPTTRYDLSLCIRDVLSRLPEDKTGQIGLVCLSTTLATNAIVENRGQPVGLILMPPYGRFDSRRFNHEPVVPIKGRLEIDGSVIEDIDPEEIIRTARNLIEKQKVAAFAIAGYASHANPDHELRAKKIVEDATGVPVTCGHEVSAGLNYRIKAETAALNARIIPCLESLLDRVQTTLHEYNITAPVMVVRSDGSLMNIKAAVKHPVQTIMSGPAASIAGAAELSGVDNAIIADIGGTTTDTAILTNGKADTCAQGATVGNWKTHVKALEMRTLGLGGDSRISLHGKEIELGPRRVFPLCRIPEEEAVPLLNWLEKNAEMILDAPDAVDILRLAAPADAQIVSGCSPREAIIIDSLRESPMTLQQLAINANLVNWRLVNTDRLESEGIIQRCGLTPTDILHASGKLDLWDTEIALKISSIFASVAKISLNQLITLVMKTFTRTLARALIETQLSKHIEPETLESSAQASEILNSALGKKIPGLAVSIRLVSPVIGIGAPAACFIPEASKLLSTQAIIPPHAEAANAVGAAASQVVVSVTATIAIDEKGRYRVTGIAGAPRFDSLEEAQEHAESKVSLLVRKAAREAGTSNTQAVITPHDQMTSLDDGSTLFIERHVTATITGTPDLP